MSDMQILFRMIDVLEQDEKAQLLEYLMEQNVEIPKATEEKRVLGLLEGKGWISDDFTAELPDEFWGFDKGFDV